MCVCHKSLFRGQREAFFCGFYSLWQLCPEAQQKTEDKKTAHTRSGPSHSPVSCRQKVLDVSLTPLSPTLAARSVALLHDITLRNDEFLAGNAGLSSLRTLRPHYFDEKERVSSLYQQPQRGPPQGGRLRVCICGLGDFVHSLS